MSERKQKRRWIQGRRYYSRRPMRGLRRGAATIELALVAPFVFLLIFAAVEFSRMMMIRQALTNAAREGCRHACLTTSRNSGDSEPIIRTVLKGVIRDATATSDIRTGSDPAFTSSPESGTKITVWVEIDSADVSWLPPFFTAGTTIRGTASMYRE